MSLKVTIIDQNPLSREELERAIIREGLEGCLVSEGINNADIYLWIGEQGQNPPNNIKISEKDRFLKPVRLGLVLDRVKRHISSGKSAHKTYKIGPFTFDLDIKELRRGTEIIRLTDKEKQILLLLHDAGGQPVDRMVLLEKVWAYTQDLDTHTLETHIYRLRQKIEQNPSSPEILLTDGAGYKISD